MTKETREARKMYYTAIDGTSREVMSINASMKIKKDRGFNLTKKQWFIVKILRQTDLFKFTQSMESLTNLWLKDCHKNGIFNASDFINASDVKKCIMYIYYNDSRLIELYKNSKGSFLIHEREFEPNLLTVNFVD